MLGNFNEAFFGHIGMCSNGDDQVYEDACAACIVYTRMTEVGRAQEIPEGLQKKLDGSIVDATGKRWG